MTNRLWYKKAAGDWNAALPKAWPSGRITGLRSRSGRSYCIEWKEGKLSQSQATPV